MVFSSAVFLYLFLPVFLTIYALTPRSLKSVAISLASWVFYGWWRPDFVLLMLFQSFVDFAIGIKIGKEHGLGRSGKSWMILSVVLNLGLLGWFKYANFGVETLNASLKAMGFVEVGWTQIVLPVGISFYTFQTMSYTIDVYWKQVEPTRRLWDFLAFVSMFPQLVAGPIVRYRDVDLQLRNRRHTFAAFSQGVLALQSGFCKKILIADVLARIADDAFGARTLSTADAWIGAAAYTFQIYFDFSGYSDMAIGLGLMIGFRFPINFNRPYMAESITDFWRRWHISLSTWLRDYLYIPLGGNRKGPIRTHVNLAATMLLGGLWHGANWTFIAWGAWQGLWLIIERLGAKSSLLGQAPRVVKIAFTMALVVLGWVFFRANGLPHALRYFAAMLGVAAPANPVIYLNLLHYVVFAAAAIATWAMPTTQSLTSRPRLPWILAIQLLFALALVHLHYQDHVPFLYFQF